VKDSLAHLPSSKRQKLNAVVELIRRDAEVEMIILFGSFARGDWVEDPIGGYFSDLDVLVIVKRPRLVENHNLWSAIEQRAARITAPTELSLLVHDIKDVNEQLEKGFYFFSDIKREGVMLYDSGRFQLAQETPRTAAERQDYAQQCFDKWFESACRFYENFEWNLSKAWLNEAAFLLHQATERLYHTVVLVFTAYKMKTHNIEDLGKRCGDLHPAFRNVFPRSTPEEDHLFKLLKSAYVDARYSSKYVVTADELRAIAMPVRDLRDRVERTCREKIAALGEERPLP
jgi:predicted nucleotidyltransferase/HEPN domain-containing protein